MDKPNHKAATLESEAEARDKELLEMQRQQELKLKQLMEE